MDDDTRGTPMTQGRAPNYGRHSKQRSTSQLLGLRFVGHRSYEICLACVPHDAWFGRCLDDAARTTWTIRKVVGKTMPSTSAIGMGLIMFNMYSTYLKMVMTGRWMEMIDLAVF